MRPLALLLVLSAAAAAQAQDTAIDVTKLGVSLERIQKELRESESADNPSPAVPRLKFLVQVYGQAPNVDLFEGVELLHGDAPGTAPTHQQLLAFLTPQTHRGQAGSISAVVAWAVVKIVNWRKKVKCEAELADYRAQLMQGRDIPAPRCTQ